MPPTRSRCITILLTVLMLLSGCTTPAPANTPVPQPVQPPTPTAEIGIQLATRAAPTAAPVQQITPTPLPSATPTPTPTTIVYTVEDGDTVWSVAYQNGTTPDELLLLNPNLRPELMSIGDTLVLPPRPTPLAQTVAGTAVPLSVQVVSLQLYRSAAGSAWLLGEVENQGSVSAENIQLQIDLGDGLGQLTTWVATPLVLPNERAPFGLLLRDFTAEPKNLTASVIAGTSVTNLGNRNGDLLVNDSTFTIDGQQIAVSGTISNTSSFTTSVSLVATFYDQAGSVSGFAQTTLAMPLVGGDSAEFSLVATAPGRAVDTIRFNITGLNLVHSAGELTPSGSETPEE